MRILYHHRTLADGAEGIHITAMVDAFRGLGHEVRVCAPASRTGSPSRVAAIKAMLPGVAFEAASLAYNGPEFLSVQRAIREWRPHFIYKRHARWDLGPLIAARLLRCPVVLEVNAIYSERPYRDFEPQVLQPVAARVERAALRSAGTVIAVSSPMAEQVARLSGRSAFVVPNGADPAFFDPARVAPAQGPWTGPPGSLVLGWSGGLRTWHGLELLLESLVCLPGHVRLLIVGDGPARSDVEARACALGVAGRVFITGLVPRAAVPAHVAAMDIGVVADERTGVASPMKLLEYMAMGKAVVAPDLPNLRDIVSDGSNGRLFRAGSAEALAAAVASLGEAQERRRLGLAARDLIVRERNWGGIAALVLRAVQKG